MLEEWVLIEFDFQFVLSIDLEHCTESMSWRRFQLLLAGLFGVEKSLVRNRFRPDKSNEQEGTDPEEE